MTKPLRPYEEFARQVISRRLGVPVEQHDDGSMPSMYDLDILYPDRPGGAVEVTSATDGGSVALAKAMYRKGQAWPVADLHGRWLLDIVPGTQETLMQAEVPGLLRELEAEEIEHFNDPWELPAEFAERAKVLGITQALHCGREQPGVIYRRVSDPADRIGGFVARTGAELAWWIAEFLRYEKQEDVRSKLAASGALECHAFVVVPVYATASFGVIDLIVREGAPLPARPPDLPPEVTDVWIGSGWDVPHVVRWGPEGGWEHVDSVTQSARRRTLVGAEAPRRA